MEGPTVVALPGSSIPSTEPVQRVVEILEECLIKARDGMIVGVAVVVVERQPLANQFFFHAEQASRHTLIAGALGMTWALGKIAAEGEE